MRALFHLSLPEDWTAAQAAGEVTDSTRGVSLAEEGYLHCSFAEQVGPTAARYYGDLDAVVLLEIDPGAVPSPIVVEDLAGSGVEFPHVYGPVPVTAVVASRLVDPRAVEV